MALFRCENQPTMLAFSWRVQDRIPHKLRSRVSPFQLCKRQALSRRRATAEVKNVVPVVGFMRPKELSKAMGM